MRIKSIALSLVLCVLLSALSGCFYLIVGGVGAVGGYAVTRDTVQGEYDARFERAWKAAQEVADTLGIMINRDKNRGLVIADIERARVRIEISQLTPEAIRIKVKARKGLFPRLRIAEDVFLKIVQRLK